MIYLLGVIAFGAAIVAAAGYAAALAFRDEHLLVLHWRDAGTVFLERTVDGRYTGRAPASLPAAVARYAVGRARGAWAASRTGEAAPARRHVLFTAHKA
ncbi:MAG: hypothetical protein JWM27_1711 [Gemmatimonadetes bacterium]|nr:hypothetical protein [Gemmatimonadota bacterium]